MAKAEKKPQMKEEGKRTNLSKELLEKTLLENPAKVQFAYSPDGYYTGGSGYYSTPNTKFKAT